MADNLAKSIINKEVPPENTGGSFTPSQKENDVIGKLVQLYRISQNERASTLEYFDGRDLTTYINDSVRRFITNVDERENIEDWQARIHAPFTRNKVLAILGKVIDALPIVEFIPRGDEDGLKAEILGTLFEYADDVDNAEEFFTYAIEEAIVKGTVVGYEGFEEKTKYVRKINKYNDGDEISSTSDKIISRKVVSKIVPLEEFYPGNIGQRDIEKMTHCFWRKILPFETFISQYENYEKAKYVEPFETHFGDEEGRPFYWDYISSDVEDGEVEVVRYYNQETDEFIIMANGIWINPLEGEQVSPIPFNHKSLPFWSIRYDILGSDFFYGKSLPDRLKSLQDVLNVLNNMLLDQSFLTIFPPILVAGMDDIEDDFLRPGRRITVDTQGLPLNQAYSKLDLGTPGNWHRFILEYTKQVLEESSLDAVQQGISGTGDRTTATEIRSASAGVVALLGLFAKFIKYGVKRRARLRAPNILQFYTDPENPIIEQVLGVGGTKEFNKIFNTIEIDSSPLTSGKRGVKIIEMYKDIKDLPTAKELRTKTKLNELTTGKKITKIAITADYIRNFEFDLRLVPNPQSPSSRELDRALEIQFQQTFLGLYPDLANREEMAARLAAKFDQDPTKVIKEGVFNPLPQTQNGPDSMIPNTGGDNSMNTIKGGTGVGQDNQLINQLTG